MSSDPLDPVLLAGRRSAQLVGGEHDLLRDAGPLSEPLNAARAVLRFEFMHDGVATLRYWQGEFLRWQGAAWRPTPDVEVEARIYAVLERHNLQPKRRQVTDVLHAMRSVALIRNHVEPPCWLDDLRRPTADLLACANGIANLATGELSEPSPNFFTLNALPVGFDPDAGEPTHWPAFLRQIWPDDQEAVETLQEIFGLTLTDNTAFQKIFLLVGPRRAGKGTIFRVGTGLLGKDNVAAPTLSGLAGPFGMQSLVGKLAAFVPDARLSGRADVVQITERLLSISGEDHVSVSRKFLPDFTARIGARFVMGSNQLPRLTDSGGALASRFIILVLRQSFYGREDTGLTGKLISELPQILQWAIAGRRRLADRGYIRQPQSAADAVRALEDLTDPIGAFVADRCDRGPGLSVTAADLFDAWRLWCEEQGRDHPGTVQTFGRDIRAAVPELRMSQPRIHGQRERRFEGIDLARTGTRSDLIHREHLKSSQSLSSDRVPTRAKCQKCDGEGCNHCEF